MFELDKNLVLEFVAESREDLAMVESDLLAIEADGTDIDEQRVNRVLRTIHTIKGASGLFNLKTIGALAHETENVLALIRSRKLVPAPNCVQVLLRATDRLIELFEHPDTSNDAGIVEVVAELTRLCTNSRPPIQKRSLTGAVGSRGGDAHLRVLLVEDDFACRLLLQTFLTRYSECHVAVNGREAIEAFRSALDRGQGYDLICMDIMMPEVDGREAVRQIRALEESRGIRSTFGAKIFMTTTVQEAKEVVLCFKELCDTYLMKPIDLGEMLSRMEAFHLISPKESPAAAIK
jgi:two-component system chemotaxis response regulator CheY